MTFTLFGVFVLYVGILLFEAPSLLMQKYWRELAALLFLWGFSLTLSVLIIFKVPVPNPQDIINNSVIYIFRLITTII